MTHTIQPLDIDLLVVARFNGTDYDEIDVATFGYSGSYDPFTNASNQTALVVGPETASVSLSSYGTSYVPQVSPGDRVRARYGDKTLFIGIVDRLTLSTTAQSGKPGLFRYDVSATLVGRVGLALARIVCYEDLPNEDPRVRMERWVTIDG